MNIYAIDTTQVKPKRFDGNRPSDVTAKVPRHSATGQATTATTVQSKSNIRAARSPVMDE